jgi:bacteriocin-like protein
MDKKQLEQAKKANSVEELSRMAKENGITLSDSAADELYRQLHASESALSDEELANVTGGGCSSSESLREKYAEVSYGDVCPSFVWSHWQPSSTRDHDHHMCLYCHYVITSKDDWGHHIVHPYCFCELQPK